MRAFISAAPRRGHNDQSLCAAGVAQFTATLPYPPPSLPCAPPSALAHHTLHGTRLVVVHTNYMTRCEEECNRRSVPVPRQINKCLMTRSVAPTNPFFDLIRKEGAYARRMTQSECESIAGGQLFIRPVYWSVLHEA